MTELSGPVRDLIAQCVDSVESVELLLLLHRSPETFWSADAAGQRLGIRPDVALKKLNALAEAGLLSRGTGTGAFRFYPLDEARKAAVDDLADAYSNRRVSVVNTIYSTNLDRLRAFTNAFKLKKP